MEHEFIKANYHTHTYRCMHAFGTEREYVEAAVNAGIKILGFSDHVPIRFPGDYVSGIRMRPDETDDYKKVLSDLRDEFAPQIELHIGFEAEYIPAYFDYHKSLIDDEGFEYLIMGEHFIDEGGPEGIYTGQPTADVDILDKYVKLVIEGAATGYFKYVAHPDLINFVGDETIYRRRMKRMCRELHQMGMPVEINALGYCTNRHYPSDRFYEIAAEEGVDVIIGMDAHTAWQLVCEESYRGCMDIVDRFGLHLIEKIDL